MASHKVYEYLTKTFNEKNNQEALNQLGVEGWELIAISCNIHYFKREREDLSNIVSAIEKQTCGTCKFRDAKDIETDSTNKLLYCIEKQEYVSKYKEACELWEYE